MLHNYHLYFVGVIPINWIDLNPNSIYLSMEHHIGIIKNYANFVEVKQNLAIYQAAKTGGRLASHPIEKMEYPPIVEPADPPEEPGLRATTAEKVFI